MPDQSLHYHGFRTAPKALQTHQSALRARSKSHRSPEASSTPLHRGTSDTQHDMRTATMRSVQASPVAADIAAGALAEGDFLEASMLLTLVAREWIHAHSGAHLVELRSKLRIFPDVVPVRRRKRRHGHRNGPTRTRSHPSPAARAVIQLAGACLCFSANSSRCERNSSSFLAICARCSFCVSIPRLLS